MSSIDAALWPKDLKPVGIHTIAARAVIHSIAFIPKDMRGHHFFLSISFLFI